MNQPRNLYSGSSLKVKLWLPLLFALLQPGAELAAADADADPAQTDQWSDVRMFEVAPVQRAVALLAPNAQTPPQPESLNPQQRLQILAGLGGNGDDDPAAGSPPGAAIETIVLSASNTVHEDKGVLTLMQPYTFHPETGIHMRGSEPGGVGVKVKVEEGSRYLVDFLVRSAVPGKYQLDTEGGTQTIEDPLGAREHIPLALIAGSSGWTTVRLRRPDSDFFLYAVEITRY